MMMIIIIVNSISIQRFRLLGLLSQGRSARCIGHTEATLRGGQIEEAQGPRGHGASPPVNVLPHPAFQGHGNPDPGNCAGAGPGQPLLGRPVPGSQTSSSWNLRGSDHPHPSVQNATFHGSRTGRSAGGSSDCWTSYSCRLSTYITRQSRWYPFSLATELVLLAAWHF